MRRNASNICPECDAGDPTSVVTECECPSTVCYECGKGIKAEAVANAAAALVNRWDRTDNPTYQSYPEAVNLRTALRAAGRGSE